VTTPLFWTKEAEADLRDAQDWYHDIRPELGRRFIQAVEATVGRIAEAPLQFPIIYRTLRRAGIRRFPYGLFFQAAEQRIVVVACFHAKRNPRHWQVR
jgi:plasmid stabilization system protein ParE